MTLDWERAACQLRGDTWYYAHTEWRLTRHANLLFLERTSGVTEILLLSPSALFVYSYIFVYQTCWRTFGQNLFKEYWISVAMFKSKCYKDKYNKQKSGGVYGLLKKACFSMLNFILKLNLSGKLLARKFYWWMLQTMLICLLDAT